MGTWKKFNIIALGAFSITSIAVGVIGFYQGATNQERNEFLPTTLTAILGSCFGGVATAITDIEFKSDMKMSIATLIIYGLTGAMCFGGFNNLVYNTLYDEGRKTIGQVESYFQVFSGLEKQALTIIENTTSNLSNIPNALYLYAQNIPIVGSGIQKTSEFQQIMSPNIPTATQIYNSIVLQSNTLMQNPFAHNLQMMLAESEKYITALSSLYTNAMAYTMQAMPAITAMLQGTSHIV